MSFSQRFMPPERHFRSLPAQVSSEMLSITSLSSKSWLQNGFGFRVITFHFPSLQSSSPWSYPVFPWQQIFFFFSLPAAASTRTFSLLFWIRIEGRYYLFLVLHEALGKNKRQALGESHIISSKANMFSIFSVIKKSRFCFSTLCMKNTI